MIIFYTLQSMNSYLSIYGRAIAKVNHIYRKQSMARVESRHGCWQN